VKPVPVPMTFLFFLDSSKLRRLRRGCTVQELIGRRFSEDIYQFHILFVCLSVLEKLTSIPLMLKIILTLVN
jgi:hypothetical protein